MCFAVPWKVIGVEHDWIILENGRKVKKEAAHIVEKGNYVRIFGSVIVDVLTEQEGKDIQQTLQQL